MLRKMKLNGKILGAIALTLFATSAVSFWITQRRVNQQAEEAFRDKVRQITGMAGATRVWFSDNIETLVPGKNFKSLNQVPVVVAWSVARQYATAQNMEFHTPSLTPRNPKNQADEFERRALEAFQQDSSLKEYSDRTAENGKNVMRYAQAIRLTQDCLLCHGDPVGAKDPFGYSKEGMKVGDLRGAFTVKASTEGLIQTANSNLIALFLTSFLTLLAAAGVLFILVHKLITKPLSSVVDLANQIRQQSGDGRFAGSERGRNWGRDGGFKYDEEQFARIAAGHRGNGGTGGQREPGTVLHQPADYGQFRRDDGAGACSFRSGRPGKHQPANSRLGRRRNEFDHWRDCQKRD